MTNLKKFGLTIHVVKKHKNLYVGCGQDFKSEADLKKHFCLEVDRLTNPCYANYFIQKRKENDHCFIVIQKKQNIKGPIAIIHREECWNNPASSCLKLNSVSPNSKDYIITDEKWQLHMPVTQVITDKTVDWDELYRSFVGFCMG